MADRHWINTMVVAVLGLVIGGVSLVMTGGVGGASPHVNDVLQVIPPSGTFPDTTLGTSSTIGAATDQDPATPYFLNNTQSTDTIDLETGVTFSGPAANDYAIAPGQCGPSGATVIVLRPGIFCYPDISFFPGALGDRAATMTVQGSADPTPVSVSLDGTGTIGYYQVDAAGNVSHRGDAAYFGDAGSMHLNSPIVGIAATGDNGGYWLVADDGGIFSYGDAQFYGSTGDIHLNKPIVGMAGTNDAGGYWMVASDGGIFAYGDAPYFGSHGGSPLNQPIVGMAPTADNGGYWLVAADGGIFAYGDAQFHGSHGGSPLNQPIVGMAPTPDDGGYWLVAADGGVFAYGDAQFYGSTGGIHLNKPIVGMAAMPTGTGYWFTAADGGLFNFGDAPFQGSGVGTLSGQVVGMASDGGATVQASFDIPSILHDHLSGTRAVTPRLPVRESAGTPRG